jgi:hypothetical protein
MNDVIAIVERIKHEPLDWIELAELTDHPNQSVRGTAIQFLASRFGGEERCVKLLEKLARDDVNHTRVMGTITLAQMCVKLLEGIGTDSAKNAVKSLISTWPEKDRADLEWFRQNG